MREILEKAKNYNEKFQLFLKIGFFTGLRTGEILALKIKDIDLKNDLIFVNSTRSRFGENSPKTYFSLRKVPLMNALKIDLKKYLEKNVKNKYLFQTQYNKPYRDDYVFTCFYKKILKELNLEYRRIYTMRHTFSTNALLSGVLNALELSKILGHSSPEMVYKVYVSYIENLKISFKNENNLYKI